MPPPPWKTELSAVFSRAVALSLPGGLLLSVIRDEEGLEALALWPGPGEFEDLGALAARGMGGDLEARERLVYRLEALYSSAEPWDPRPRLARLSRASAEGKFKQLATEAGVREAVAEADTGRPASRGLSGVLGPGGDDTIRGDGPFGRAFMALARREDFPAALVGFGPGTTPAGDDWLAGFLCAADLASGLGPGKAENALREEIKKRLERTTDAGRSLLSASIEGIPPRFLCTLAEAATEAGDIRRAVAAALAHGASSGRDSIDGFLAALRKYDATAEARPALY